MPKIEASHDSYMMEILSDNIIDMRDPLWLAFLKNFNVLQESVDLVSFKVIKGVTNFSYEFELEDGRVWKQEIYIPSDESEASMNFDVPDMWKAMEFVSNRAVRDSVIQMVNSFAVTKIEVTF